MNPQGEKNRHAKKKKAEERTQTLKNKVAIMMKLPKGFEKAIMELEMQLEKEAATQELVAMLLSLYSVRMNMMWLGWSGAL